MANSSTSQNTIISREASSHSSYGLFWKQLSALLWKSLITRRVHYVSTFFELIGPLLLPLFACLLVSSVNLSNDTQQDTSSVTVPEYLGPKIYTSSFMKVRFDEFDFKLNDGYYTVFYAPQNEITNRLISSFGNFVEVYGVNSEQDIWDRMLSKMANLTDTGISMLQMIGISFGDISLSNGQISYSLLVPSTKEFNTMTGQKYPMKFNQAPAPTSHDYFRFVQVSSYINRELVRESCQFHAHGSCEQASKPIEIFQMPYPRYENPESQQQFSVFDWVGLLTVLGYVLVCPLIVKRITDEKDSKVKEMLRMIGMSDLVFWSSHFISYFVIVIIQAFIFVFIFFSFQNSVVNHSSMSLFVIFFIIYGAQLILFSMLITTIFNR